ncbi:MAG TPA: GNAT family N-acetyltransferase [Hyphomonadaceae bacterium]|nr:GNAT family N-acetyltransferase [Hyphomonadaceae bacterium]HPN06162.1 GNAT family N-acetyltransferase [Hyphomonadaceae bacterium]
MNDDAIETSMTISFEPADAKRDRDVMLDLNIQYFAWMEACIRRDFGIEISDLLGGSIQTYVASALDKLCAAQPPEGVFYIVRRNGRPAGMGGVRKLADGVSEMKRVFVAPDQRGGGLGAIIVKRLIADSDAFGYPVMRLDSGPFMASAHKLYEVEGFKDRDAYEGVEVPPELRHNWRFMERS